MPELLERNDAPSILTREVASTDPRNFRHITIDPLEIYGVKDAIKRAIETGEAPVILDHPAFPNPRATPCRETVEDIKEAGSIDDPIKLYWDGDGNVILADGKTRMTAIVEDLVENHRSTTFDRWQRVPYIRLRVSNPDDVRLYMIKANMDGTRTALNDFEVGMAIDRLERSGVTEQYIATALNKLGRGGISYIRKLKDVFNANPRVVESLRTGTIDLVTAANIVRKVDGFKEQGEAVTRVVEAIHAGATQATARQAAGVKPVNRTTLGFADTYEHLVENFYSDFRRILEKDAADPKRHEKLDWTDSAQRDDYHTELIVMTAFDMAMRHLKQDHLLLEDQLKWVDSHLTEEQGCLIEGLWPISKLKLS